MSLLSRIEYSYSASDDFLPPPEKRLKNEFWENRIKRLETGEESDCKIIVGDKTIPTHKFVLTDFPYFKKKLRTQSDYKSNECDQINILNYDYAIVSEMVKYIYSLNVNISTENVEDLLKISDEYQVIELFEKAEKFMVDHIETVNVINCLTLAEHIANAKLLKSASIDYILDHYFELKATESWKKLSGDLFEEILHHKMLNERITDINAINADELLDMANKHHVKKLATAVQKFMRNTPFLKAHLN